MKYKTEKSIVPDYSSNYVKSCTCKKNPKPTKPSCDCEQLFYAPLPNLPIRPPTERITPLEWFAPGTVKTCCSITSTIRPIYNNYNNYNNNNYNNNNYYYSGYY